LRHIFLILVGLALALTASGAAAWVEHPGDGGDLLLPYLVEYRCGEAATPWSCTNPVPHIAYENRYWRRYDLGLPPAGYVASESVLLQVTGSNVVAQTWSWSPFGKFNQTRGDGGQVLLTDGHAATYLYTQDGSYAGKQYFCGDGWPIARSDFDATWRVVVPQLAIGKGGWDQCPTARVPGYTRYRLITGTVFPAAWQGAPFTLPVNTLVSEHYGGSLPVYSCAMERFEHGWHYGLLRWEAWNQCGLAPTADLATRCPAVTGIGPPEGYPSFQLTDCRTFTNFVPEPGTASLQDDGWP
jgi:hypothetical protein